MPRKHRHPHKRPRSRWGMIPLGLQHRYPPCCVLAFVLRCRRIPAQAYVLGVRAKRGSVFETYVPCRVFHQRMWTWDEHKALTDALAEAAEQRILDLLNPPGVV